MLPASIIGFMLGVLFVVRLPIGPISTDVLALGIAACAVGAAYWRRRPKLVVSPEARLLTAVLLGLLSTLVAGFVLGGHTSFTDLRYLVRWAEAFAWLPLCFVALQTSRAAMERAVLAGLATAIAFMLVMAIAGIIDAGTAFPRQVATSSWIDATVFRNPNEAARTALMLFVLGYWMFPRRSLPAAVATLVLLAAIVGMTVSRSSLLALGLGCVAMALRPGLPGKQLRWPVLTLVVGLSIVVVLAAWQAGWSRIEQAQRVVSRLDHGLEAATTDEELINTRTFTGRAAALIATLQIVKANPLTGIGYADRDDVLALYGSIRRIGDAASPDQRLQVYAPQPFTIIAVHGAPFAVAVYAGLPAAVMLLGGAGVLLWLAVQGYRGGQIGSARHAAYSLFLMVLILMAVNIFANNIDEGPTWMALSPIVSVVLGYRIKSLDSQACAE